MEPKPKRKSSCLTNPATLSRSQPDVNASYSELPFDKPVRAVDQNQNQYVLYRSSADPFQRIIIDIPTDLLGVHVRPHPRGCGLFLFTDPKTKDVIELEVI